MTQTKQHQNVLVVPKPWRSCTSHRHAHAACPNSRSRPTKQHTSARSVAHAAQADTQHDAARSMTQHATRNSTQSTTQQHASHKREQRKGNVDGTWHIAIASRRLDCSYNTHPRKRVPRVRWCTGGVDNTEHMASKAQRTRRTVTECSSMQHQRPSSAATQHPSHRATHAGTSAMLSTGWGGVGGGGGQEQCST
mgnify:CR=1 FL=1